MSEKKITDEEFIAAMATLLSHIELGTPEARHSETIAYEYVDQLKKRVEELEKREKAAIRVILDSRDFEHGIEVLPNGIHAVVWGDGTEEQAIELINDELEVSKDQQ